MNAKMFILVAVLTLNTKTCSCDDGCNVTNHSDEESDYVNVCFNNTKVQLLTCSGDNVLVITDVVQRIKKKRCYTTEECCKVKDSDVLQYTGNCAKVNPTFTTIVNEIISKCIGRKFCYFLEPKSSIWPFIEEGKHPNASHLKISYKCNNWPRYEMCGNTPREVTPPFHISTSSQNHSNCSCDIYTKDQTMFILFVTLDSHLGNIFTIRNSTHKENFIGGRDALVLYRKLGSWSKVSVVLVINEQKTSAEILVKGTAKKVQLKCHGVKTGKKSKTPHLTENISNDSTKWHPRLIGILFASGFIAACFAIGLTGACVLIRKRKSSQKSSAATYTKNSDKTGTGDDSQRSANEIVIPGPSRQDAAADESDTIDEDAEHIYTFPIRLSSDGSVSAHRRSAISEKGSLHVDCEESCSCQQHKAEPAQDLACYPNAPPRAKGKRKCMKVPEESSETVVVDVEKVVLGDL